MDAVKYLKLKGKMTLNCQTDCRICRLSRYNNGFNKPCRIFETRNADKAVEIVEKWAEEHPVKTRKDKFLEMYPNAFVNTVPDGTFVDICPLDVDIFYGKCNLQSEDINDCLLCKISYWNKEVEDTNERD